MRTDTGRNENRPRGLARRGRQFLHDQETKDRVLRMIDRGLTAREISKALGGLVHELTIGVWLAERRAGAG
jgi:hypothetical protein